MQVWRAPLSEASSSDISGSVRRWPALAVRFMACHVRCANARTSSSSSSSCAQACTYSETSAMKSLVGGIAAAVR